MIEWDDKFATGVEKIDEQHKKLFKMLNDFETLVQSGDAEARFEDALKFLGNYTKVHFGCEEICMQQMACPVLEVNKKAHASFLAVFEGFMDRFKSEGYSDALANELLRTAQGWLVKHICGVDVKMNACASVG